MARYRLRTPDDEDFMRIAPSGAQLNRSAVEGDWRAKYGNELDTYKERSATFLNSLNNKKQPSIKPIVKTSKTAVRGKKSINNSKNKRNARNAGSGNAGGNSTYNEDEARELINGFTDTFNRLLDTQPNLSSNGKFGQSSGSTSLAGTLGRAIANGGNEDSSLNNNTANSSSSTTSLENNKVYKVGNRTLTKEQYDTFQQQKANVRKQFNAIGKIYGTIALGNLLGRSLGLLSKVGGKAVDKVVTSSNKFFPKNSSPELLESTSSKTIGGVPEVPAYNPNFIRTGESVGTGPYRPNFVRQTPNGYGTEIVPSIGQQIAQYGKGLQGIYNRGVNVARRVGKGLVEQGKRVVRRGSTRPKNTGMRVRHHNNKTSR